MSKTDQPVAAPALPAAAAKPASKPRRARRMAREPHSAAADQPTAAVASTALTAAAPKVSKTELVLALLRREEGATLVEITTATGWLPHSARAFLTGLRKQGHTLARERTDGVTRYSVVERGDAQG